MTMSSCAGTHAMAMRQPLSFDGVHNFLDTLFGDDLHAKRVKSLAGATLGAIQSASLAVGLIGQGLALARGRLTKHAVKQVDRLLSNQGIDVDALLVHWVPYVVDDGVASSLGTNPGGHVNFNTTWGIELNYVQPLGFLPSSIPLTYKALVSIHGPKGAGEPNAPSRIAEYYMEQTLSLDIGQMIADKPNKVYLWGSYRWWVNKFGLNPSTTGLCCTTESTWITGVTFAF